MASYRCSVSVIGRSGGSSAVAAAAYRSASLIEDERHGERQDYRRKGGVVHSEIMAPEDAPEWMRDRGQLWNGVEAAERRKDSRLAREVQLSLPHELTDEQRRELVRSFAAEQFVARGMIADVNIHRPGSRDGDDRNHHAHIMLTLRELTGEGFGKVNRSWNDKANVELWREQWAAHQNRAFEKLGLEVRVDHRSLEAQGIDREPQQHEGPHASAMARRGDDTRIGAENEAREDRNRGRALSYAAALTELVKIEEDRARLFAWQAEIRCELGAKQRDTILATERAHAEELAAFKDRIGDIYGPGVRTVQAEIDAIRTRLDDRGLRARMRRVFRGRDDRARLDVLQRNMADARQRMNEVLGGMKSRQAAELARVQSIQTERRAQQTEGLDRLEKRKTADFEARQKKAEAVAKAKVKDDATLKAALEAERAKRDLWRTARQMKREREAEQRGDRKQQAERLVVQQQEQRQDRLDRQDSEKAAAWRSARKDAADVRIDTEQTAAAKRRAREKRQQKAAERKHGAAQRLEQRQERQDRFAGFKRRDAERRAAREAHNARVKAEADQQADARRAAMMPELQRRYTERQAEIEAQKPGHIKDELARSAAIPQPESAADRLKAEAARVKAKLAAKMGKSKDRGFEP